MDKNLINDSKLQPINLDFNKKIETFLRLIPFTSIVLTSTIPICLIKAVELKGRHSPWAYPIKS